MNKIASKLQTINRRSNAVAQLKVREGPGLFGRDVPLSPCEAADRIARGQTVEFEEAFYHRQPCSDRFALSHKQSTYLESPGEVDDFYSYRNGNTNTPRERVAKKFGKLSRYDAWAVRDAKTGLFGKKKPGNEGLSDFEAAGRILNGEAVTLNHAVGSDTEAHFVATPQDLLRLLK